MKRRKDVMRHIINLYKTRLPPSQHFSMPQYLQLSLVAHCTSKY